MPRLPLLPRAPLPLLPTVTLPLLPRAPLPLFPRVTLLLFPSCRGPLLLVFAVPVLLITMPMLVLTMPLLVLTMRLLVLAVLVLVLRVLVLVLRHNQKLKIAPMFFFKITYWKYYTLSQKCYPRMQLLHYFTARLHFLHILCLCIVLNDPYKNFSKCDAQYHSL